MVTENNILILFNQVKIPVNTPLSSRIEHFHVVKVKFALQGKDKNNHFTEMLYPGSFPSFFKLQN
jgi:hypothetical protein